MLMRMVWDVMVACQSADEVKKVSGPSFVRVLWLPETLGWRGGVLGVLAMADLRTSVVRVVLPRADERSVQSGRILGKNIRLHTDACTRGGETGLRRRPGSLKRMEVSLVTHGESTGRGMRLDDDADEGGAVPPLESGRVDLC
jgi:hypothetical protein